MIELPEALTKVLDASIEQIYGLSVYVEPTVVLVPSIVTAKVHDLADSIGFDVETLNYVLGMFMCYPLGIIMNALPYGPVRHMFSFLLGAFLLQFILGVQWIHHMITSLAVYAMILVLPRSSVKTAVPVFVMLYMTLGHLHRQYINYMGWDLDFTGTQMVLTQKLYMLAYNLYDGEQLAKNKTDRAATKCKAYALADIPGIIEYLGYTFCFSTLLAGPAYEFATYCHACDGSLLYDKDGKPRGKIPSNVVPTLIPFVKSVVCMGVFVVASGMFPLLDPEDPQKNLPVLIQPEFLEKAWAYRYAYMWIGLAALRQKYYFAWNSAEGASNIWYAGFDGFDDNGNPKGWETANNIDILQFETAPNVSTLSRVWNKKTSDWLSKYVYIRTNGSLLAVYSMSAFWHGFYPGYYLFFMSIPILTFCERLAKKKISPYFSNERISVYGLICSLFTSFFVEYMVSAFILLALASAWGNWKSHMFFGHIVAIGFYAVLTVLPTPKKAADKKKSQ